MSISDEEHDSCWRYTKGKTGTHFTEPYSPEKCGKWMIFPSLANAEKYWSLIKNSKRLHAKMSIHSSNGRCQVICVYAHEDHKTKVREILTELGFTKTLPWKYDAATLRGEYSESYIKGVSAAHGVSPEAVTQSIARRTRERK